MDSLQIQKVEIPDVLELQRISQQTFYETFHEYNTEENMKNYLTTHFSLENLSSELVDRNSEFYFAKLNDKIIGYLKINFGNAQTERINPSALEIERIYLIEKFQGRKIGIQLLQKAIYIAQQKNLNFVWLGVWEKNTKAIDFYKNNGFIEFDKHIFTLGSDEQLDILMKYVLP